MKQWIIRPPIVKPQTIEYNYLYELNKVNYLLHYNLELKVYNGEGKDLCLDINITMSGKLKAASVTLLENRKVETVFYKNKALPKFPETIDLLIDVIKKMCKKEGIPSFDQNILTHMSRHFNFNENAVGLKQIIRFIEDKKWDHALKLGEFYQQNGIYEPIWQLGLSLRKKFLNQKKQDDNLYKKDKITKIFLRTFISIVENNIYFDQANRILQEIYNISFSCPQKAMPFSKKHSYYDDSKLNESCNLRMLSKKINQVKIQQEKGYHDAIKYLAKEYIDRQTIEVAVRIVREINLNNPHYNQCRKELWELFIYTVKKDLDTKSFKQALETKLMEIIKECKKDQFYGFSINKIDCTEIVNSLIFLDKNLNGIRSSVIESDRNPVKVSECDYEEFGKVSPTPLKKKVAVFPKLISL